MKKLLLKSFLLIFIVMILHAAFYALVKKESDVYPESVMRVLNTISYIDADTILYFGDSVLNVASVEDKNTDSIPTYLHELLGDKNLVALYHAAYDSDMYMAVCRALLNRKMNFPKTVIVPINMRVFSRRWAPEASNQFMREKFVLSHDNLLTRLFFRPLVVFKVIRDQAAVDGGSALLFHRRKADADCFPSYDYDLRTSNRKFDSLMNFVAFLNEQKTQVLFYISPVDAMAMSQCTDPSRLEMVRENVRLIGSALKRNGYDVLDLSEILPSSVFVDGDHLNEAGRRAVARKIFDQLTQTKTK